MLTASRLFDPLPFSTSPLYTELCRTGAQSDVLRDLARHARPGQRPEFLLFGAVHLLLLAGSEDELTRFYPSVAGADARAPRGAGPAFEAFCRRHSAALADVIGTRLVQTNHVRRSVGLRVALALVAPHVTGPVDLVEIGASAGLLLGFDGYGYRLHDGDTVYRAGDATSPVQLDCTLHGAVPPPDPDALPEVRSVVGVDLDPVDPTDPDARAWLNALVWPEDVEQRRLLRAALDLAAARPPTLLGGDAVDVLSRVASTLPAGGDRVVFHCATRIHVPADRLAAFDAAIAAVGDGGRLWHVAIEYSPEPDPRPSGPLPPGVAVTITDPGGACHRVAVVDGHLRWMHLLPNELRGGRR